MNLLTIGKTTLPIIEGVEYRLLDERRMEDRDCIEIRLVVSIQISELKWVNGLRDIRLIEPLIKKIFKV